MIDFFIGDCRKIVPELSDNFNLVLTSPPYNTSQEYEPKLTDEEYVKYLYSCFEAILPRLDDQARLCINVPFNMTNPEGNVTNVYALVYDVLKGLGFHYRETIIWDQLNAENDTAWGSWKSASAPWLRHKTEAVLVMYSGKWARPKGVDDITGNEFMKSVVDIWPIAVAKRQGHPCPYPLELAERCIKLFSFVGDWVLDPFLGSGTTLLACRRCNRNGIGVELHEKYRQEIERKALIRDADIREW